MEKYKEVIAALVDMSQKRKMYILSNLASEYPEVFMEIELGTFLPFQTKTEEDLNEIRACDYDKGYSDGYGCARAQSSLPDPTEQLCDLPFWAWVALDMALSSRKIDAIKLVRSISNNFSLLESKNFVDCSVKTHVAGYDI